VFACAASADSCGAFEFLGGLVQFQTEPAAALEKNGDVFGVFDFASEASATAAEAAAAGPPPVFSSHGPVLHFHFGEGLFRHGDANDEFRHIGLGDPLVGTSWLNRPLHFGWFAGGLVGDELIGGRVDQTEDLFGGYRLGWDWDHYWGGEVRVAFARPDLADASSWQNPRISRDWFLDANVAYYPWGDARWRPYFTFGLGIATFRFQDELLTQHEETLLHMPLGGGVKYLVDRWLVVRADVVDNIAFGSSGLDTMHNFTYTFGLEAHFGPGSPRRYGPW
jgi:hypothetical protein